MLARVIIVVILGDLIGETKELIKQVVVGGMQPRNRCPESLIQASQPNAVTCDAIPVRAFIGGCSPFCSPGVFVVHRAAGYGPARDIPRRAMEV